VDHQPARLAQASVDRPASVTLAPLGQILMKISSPDRLDSRCRFPPNSDVGRGMPENREGFRLLAEN
jgi:hypothetical protein